MSWNNENTNFLVVINNEEQYSIWPDYKSLPGGWKKEGKTGSKQECLNHIDSTWVDMRPKSLRNFLEAKKV